MMNLLQHHNNLYLKKSFNNYYSEKEAPFGWKESLEYVFKKENLNF